MVKEPTPQNSSRQTTRRSHHHPRPHLPIIATLLLAAAIFFGNSPANFRALLSPLLAPIQVFSTNQPVQTQPSETRQAAPTNGQEAAAANTAAAAAAQPLVTGQLTGQLTVHFIDVGQADCMLAIQGDHAMLIDAGNNDDADTVITYLKKQGVSRLDYLIATHPHEDHIGSVDNVIRTFNIGKVLMPDLSTRYKTYTDVIQAIDAKNLTVIHPNFGQVYQLGDASFKILSQPASEYFSVNAASLILRISFGQNAFLLTGDAEVTEEEQLLSTDIDIHADVLKVGHHGSNSSTSVAFLEAVAPSAAVIEVSADNPYGYPDSDVLNDLVAAHAAIYRTDLAGDIIATSNGQTITFDKLPKTGTHGTRTK